MKNNKFIKILTIIFFIIINISYKNNYIFYKNIKINNEFIYNKLPFIKNIYFNYDNFFLKKNFKNILNEYIIYIRNNPNKKIILNFYINKSGNIKYNLYFNKKRIRLISNYLFIKGINIKNIKYIICIKNNIFFYEKNIFTNNKLIINII
ncbi:peptidoglycan-binding protein [Candidatus Portiera aleyrodidarum]|uniref:Peptidoglycan-associated lipoprotein n=1 Tax=Candidatus Portiera aleyrodidarum TaxID=91844 RepID=A0A8D9JUH2_9GAMM|nr:peptidoglycan-binding protein [Candidatus Portiera aleyrodidarum]CEI58769.1 Peptidoglycan-associated lipoprotein [Candidatus Portiera aleyrodidarum]